MSSKVIKLNNDALSLSENLRLLFDKNKLNANQIAQALGIPMMTVRRLLLGETADPRISTLKLIADYFDVTVDSLIDNNFHASINASKHTQPVFVPILNWKVAATMDNTDEVDLSQWNEWQPISLTEGNSISEQAFALESRPSMYPRFPQETLFIIDPSVTPTDGDIVLVNIKKHNELTLRELIIDPPDWQLQPIVSGSSSFGYSEAEHHIVGVNVLTMLYNRKIYD